MGDLAARLPATWEGDVAWEGAGTEEGRQLPDADWLSALWDLVNEHALAFPPELSHVLAVPLTDGRLASVGYCRQHAALSSAHLASMESLAPEWLSACGCICVADSSADMACESMQGEPITTALSVAAAEQGIPLKRLVSEGYLGSTTFTALCDTLSNLDLDKATLTEQSRIWGVLKQCTIFELLSGVKVNLSASKKNYMLLPNQAWEERLLNLSHLLPWTIIKHHSGTATQKRLWKRLHPLGGLGYNSLSIFLNHDILPAIYSSGSNKLEPLLLHALDDLANMGSPCIAQPLHLFVSGKLLKISKVADSNSSLLRFLFNNQPRFAAFSLLPNAYTLDNRLAFLKTKGLAHEGTADYSFFLDCAKAFIYRCDRHPDMDDSTMLRHSMQLASMLRDNVTAYRRSCGHGLWDRARESLATIPIFMAAQLTLPYKTCTDECLVSLEESADHACHRLVSNILPITHAGMDTAELRRMLELPEGPQAEHVILHLLMTAGERNAELHSQSTAAPIAQMIRQDVAAAYQHIVKEISKQLRNGQDGCLSQTAKDLSEAPWVMVHDHEFVPTEELYFDIDEETQNGTGLAVVQCSMLYISLMQNIIYVEECPVLSAQCYHLICRLHLYHVHAVSILVFHLDMHKPD